MDINTDDILVVRRGPGANCSSVGSAIDILFLSAIAAGVVLAGVAAALGEHARRTKPDRPAENGDSAERAENGEHTEDASAKKEEAHDARPA